MRCSGCVTSRAGPFWAHENMDKLGPSFPFMAGSGKMGAMFGDGSISFREFAMREQVTLAAIQDAVFQFLKGQHDCALFGAQAVNAYVDEPRMTQDVDVLSIWAQEFAQELCEHLTETFRIAVRVHTVSRGRGYRIFQKQKSGNRHLVDIRPVGSLPVSRRVKGVLVICPEELIAAKVIACCRRRGNPKSFTDRRDLAELLLRFPKLKSEMGAVRRCLASAGADAAILSEWGKIVAEKISRGRESDEF